MADRGLRISKANRKGKYILPVFWCLVSIPNFYWASGYGGGSADYSLTSPNMVIGLLFLFLGLSALLANARVRE
jgi:hypothetical protein